MGNESTSNKSGLTGFYGRFRIKLDSKGRVTLPSIYRRALGVAETEDAYLVLRLGQQEFVQLVPYESYDKVIESSRKKTTTTGIDRQWENRGQSTPVDVVNLDHKGRLTVPQGLIDGAKLGPDVLIVGVRGHMELWKPETFFRLEKDHGPVDTSIDDALYD